LFTANGPLPKIARGVAQLSEPWARSGDERRMMTARAARDAALGPGRARDTRPERMMTSKG
jgi:hypothetical protein